MRLALFQPDIPQNVGATIRLTACFGVPLEVIEPCAFRLDDRGLKRAALDYGPLAHMVLRPSWLAFAEAPERATGRLVLFTTRADQGLHDFAFTPGDTLLFGRESAGVPDEVHAAADARLLIPIRAETRSLNLAVAAGIGLAEALRQTGGFPPSSPSPSDLIRGPVSATSRSDTHRAARAGLTGPRIKSEGGDGRLGLVGRETELE